MPANGANQNNQNALYAALIEALHAITEQEKATAKQARAENEAFISPAHVQEGLLFVGFLYSFLAWKQWRAINEQATIAKEVGQTARQSLLLQFRPKLIVRNFVVPPGLDVGDKAPVYYFIRNAFVTGQFYVANIGDSAATITESHCIVHWRKEPLPMKRPYEGDNGNNPVRGKIEAGGRMTAVFDSQRPLDISHIEIGLMGYPDFKPACR